MKRQDILDILGIEKDNYSKKQLNSIIREYKYMEQYIKDDETNEHICLISDYGVYFGGKIYHKLNYLLACEKAL